MKRGSADIRIQNGFKMNHDYTQRNTDFGKSVI